MEPTFQDADHSSDEYPADETDHASQGSFIHIIVNQFRSMAKVLKDKGNMSC